MTVYEGIVSYSKVYEGICSYTYKVCRYMKVYEGIIGIAILHARRILRTVDAPISTYTQCQGSPIIKCH